MKVYQVVGGYNYENHVVDCKEVKVFSSQAKAEEYKKYLEEREEFCNYDYVDVFEFEVE